MNGWLDRLRFLWEEEVTPAEEVPRASREEPAGVPRPLRIATRWALIAVAAPAAAAQAAAAQPAAPAQGAARATPQLRAEIASAAPSVDLKAAARLGESLMRPAPCSVNFTNTM